MKAFRFKPNKRIANDGGTSIYTNEDKALAAQEALNHYPHKEDENEDETNMTDLIADIGHLCDMNHIDFERVLRCATMHWEEER